MNGNLPHFVKARPDDPPDAYLIDGASVMPLLRIEKSMDAQSSVPAPQLPAGVAEIAAIHKTIVEVGRAPGNIVGLHVAGLEDVDRGLLEMNRREVARLKVSVR